MGLDSVELVMAFEEEFGVVISDSDAEKMATPRCVIEFLLGRLDSGSTGHCLTQRGFHRLRAALMSATDVERSIIRPDVRLDLLLPRATRRGSWQKVCTALHDLPLPNLELPRWICWMLFSAMIAVAVWVFALTVRLGTPGWAILLAGMSFCAVWALGYSAATPLRLCFPQRGATIRGLLFSYTPARAQRLIASTAGVTRENIATAVRAIVIEQLGISAEQYREDARFIEDLGVD